MEASNRMYTELVGGAVQYVIPVFRRDYNWDEEQCARWKFGLSLEVQIEWLEEAKVNRSSRGARGVPRVAGRGNCAPAYGRLGE